MIKAGEVVFMKTTGEPMFVLGIDAANSQFGDVKVRRPLFGQNGTSYHVDYFFAAELETSEAQKQRMLIEQEEMNARYRKVLNSATPVANPGQCNN